MSFARMASSGFGATLEDNKSVRVSTVITTDIAN